MIAQPLHPKWCEQAWFIIPAFVAFLPLGLLLALLSNWVIGHPTIPEPILE
ncbi:MAG TPA: hypothetical protein V6C85_08015 [Allocoleopsis sp.]